MDTTEVIAYLVRDTDLSETAQVTTFVGYRPADGGMQEVSVAVLDAGGRCSTRSLHRIRQVRRRQGGPRQPCRDTG